jgi:hypothetical protein
VSHYDEILSFEKKTKTQVCVHHKPRQKYPKSAPFSKTSEWSVCVWLVCVWLVCVWGVCVCLCVSAKVYVSDECGCAHVSENLEKFSSVRIEMEFVVHRLCVRFSPDKNHNLQNRIAKLRRTITPKGQTIGTWKTPLWTQEVKIECHTMTKF